MNMNTSKYREWAAYECYLRQVGHNGVRWGVLRQTLKEKYRNEADALISKWLDGEARAKKSRAIAGRLMKPIKEREI